MNNKKFLLILSVLFLLFMNCSDSVLIEKGYVIPEEEEEEYTGPVFEPETKDASFDAVTDVSFGIVNPLKFSSPTTIIKCPEWITVNGPKYAKTSDPIDYSPYYYSYQGHTFIGYYYSRVFHRGCQCGHRNYWIITYHITDNLYLSPVPNLSDPDAWRHDEGYIAPRVIKYEYEGNDKYIMWFTKCYREYDNSAEGKASYYTKFNYKYETLCMKSTDGITWTEQTDNTFYEEFTPTTDLDDKGGIIVSDVVKYNDSFFSGFYIGKDTISADDECWRMYCAYTKKTQPTYWNRNEGTALFLGLDVSDEGIDKTGIGLGSVIIDDSNEYKMWYTATKNKKSTIGYATSFDGLQLWSKYSTSKSVFAGKKGKFDQYSVADPYVINENNLYKMYYSGSNGLSYKIGIAYSYDGKEFGYYDNQNYNPINLNEGSNDVRYPYILIDEVSGNKIFRLYYCKKESGVWKIHMIESLPMS